MSSTRRSLVLLLVLQVVAVILYPPNFFTGAPQAAVLLPFLVILLALALVGMNTGALVPDSGRSFLVFIQGINIVVRIIAFFPNLRNAAGEVDFFLMAAHLVGIGLSWYAIGVMENRSPVSLLLKAC